MGFAMTWSQLLPVRRERFLGRRFAFWMILGYPALYTVGYLSKSVAGSAAI
jgi:hypothetical protein